MLSDGRAQLGIEFNFLSGRCVLVDDTQGLSRMLNMAGNMREISVSRREAISTIGASGLMGLAGCTGIIGDDEPEYPTQTIEILIPFPQGGGTDLETRLLIEYLQDELDTDIIASNESAAAGAVLNSRLINEIEPDGYTLASFFYPLVHSFPAVLDDFDYDADKLTLIAQFSQEPFNIMTGYDSEFETFGDFLEFAEGGSVTMAVTGPVAPVVVPILLLQRELDFELNPVFVGGGENLPVEAQAGRVDVAANTMGATAKNYAEQRTRPLAILWEKDDEMIDFYEESQGITLEDHMFITEYSDQLEEPPLLTAMKGLMGPPGLPDDIVAILEEAALNSMANEEWHQDMANLGSFPMPAGRENLQERWDSYRSQMDPYIPMLRDFAAEHS